MFSILSRLFSGEDRPQGTVLAKYVYLDVVGFTHRRTVEAQSYIVKTLNGIVLRSLSACEIARDSLIMIPTGDGICVALINAPSPDAYMRIAIQVMAGVHENNVHVMKLVSPDTSEQEYTSILMRTFEVRIGLNLNSDNLVTDINGRRNVAGAGISMASRIMDCADGSQILVSQSVFEELNQREQYNGKFRELRALIKHGQVLQMNQLIDERLSFLNTDEPRASLGQAPSVEALGAFAAFYIAYAAAMEDKIRDEIKKEDLSYCMFTLFLLAQREVERYHVESNSPIDESPDDPWIAKGTFPEIVVHIRFLVSSIAPDGARLMKHLLETLITFELSRYEPYFVPSADPWRKYCTVSEAGKGAARSDPRIKRMFADDKMET